MLYSLLLATADRTQEVDHFLNSLGQQTLRDFEVIIIDQNEDDRLADTVRYYAKFFPIQQLRSPRGHSRAFNAGLPIARGEIVAFPDDDCWYGPGLLQQVADLFVAHPACSGITGRAVVEPGFTNGGRWDTNAGPVTRQTIWRRAISFSMFLRRRAAQRYRFDETLGVGAGTPWGAGEETDYLLKLIADHRTLLYDPAVVIWHQGHSGPYTDEVHSKAFKYGMGMGRVLRKNRYAPWSVAYHLARPLGGAAHALATGLPGKARYHWSVFSGRLRGWRSAPNPVAEFPRVAPSPQLASNREDLSA